MTFPTSLRMKPTDGLWTCGPVSELLQTVGGNVNFQFLAFSCEGIPQSYTRVLSSQLDSVLHWKQQHPKWPVAKLPTPFLSLVGPGGKPGMCQLGSEEPINGTI